MTTDQKLDLLLNRFRLDFSLWEAREEKQNNVRKQDFEAAVKSREKEVAIIEQIKAHGKIIEALLTNEQNDERSVATDDAT
jgi:hypothetical protein